MIISDLRRVLVNEAQSGQGRRTLHLSSKDVDFLQKNLRRYAFAAVKLHNLPPAPIGAVCNFDGVWLMEDPTLDAGQYRFE